MQKKVLIVTELFNIAANDIHAKKSVRYSWALVVTELVESGPSTDAMTEAPYERAVTVGT